MSGCVSREADARAHARSAKSSDTLSMRVNVGCEAERRPQARRRTKARRRKSDTTPRTAYSREIELRAPDALQVPSHWRCEKEYFRKDLGREAGARGNERVVDGYLPARNVHSGPHPHCICVGLALQPAEGMCFLLDCARILIVWNVGCAMKGDVPDAAGILDDLRYGIRLGYMSCA